MRAGPLDRRITIQTLTETQDDYGGVVEAWADFASNIAANVRPVRGDERQQNTDQREATADTLFSIRYRRGITMKHRIVYDGDNYDIVHKAPFGRRDRLVLSGRAVIA